MNCFSIGLHQTLANGDDQQKEKNKKKSRKNKQKTKTPPPPPPLIPPSQPLLSPGSSSIQGENLDWVVKAPPPGRKLRKRTSPRQKKKKLDAAGSEDKDERTAGSTRCTSSQSQNPPAAIPAARHSPALENMSADIGPSTTSSSTPRRGRPMGTGIGKYKTEKYRELIELGVFRDYDFPTGKRVKKGEEAAASTAIGHMEEVAVYVIEDMYVQLTGGLIIPEGAPVAYFGM